MSEFEEFEQEAGSPPPEEIAKGEYEPPAVADLGELPDSQSLPGLMTAADLLPPEEDPLEGIPSEPADADTPPDEAVPTFLIRRNRYGPGAHSVLFSDGTPVGVWLDQERHDADPGAVHAELLALGLDEDLALSFAERRAGRIEAEATLRGNAAIVAALADEQERLSTKETVQAAFLAAQKKKAKE